MSRGTSRGAHDRLTLIEGILFAILCLMLFGLFLFVTLGGIHV